MTLSGHHHVVQMGLEHLDGYIACYRQVYGEAEAWNEFKKCSNKNCGKKWGIEQWALYLIKRHATGGYINHCSICNSEVVDFWPVDKVRTNIMADVLDNPLGLGFVLINNTQIIGFIHGYEIDVDEFETKPGGVPGLADALQRWLGNGWRENKPKVFYQAELGILSPYHNLGFGKILTGLRLLKTVEAGYNIGVFRTNPEAKSLILGRNYGYKNIFQYSIPGSGPGSEETRIIMASDLSLAKDIFLKRDGQCLKDYQ